MALRDPGAPRRNPLFAVDEPAPDRPTGASDGTGDDANDDANDDGWDDWADDPIFGGSANPLFGVPGSAVGPLVSALTEAGPEAAEHLVNAAHEFTLAIKVVVDAFERTLGEQRAAFAAEHLVDLVDPPVVAPPRVQNIDLE
jgi:hypothetical protein